MTYLLNQDTCIAHLKGNRRVTNRIQRAAGQLHLGAITIFTLERWLFTPAGTGPLLSGYGVFVRIWQLLAIDDDIAHRAASLELHLRRAGHRLGVTDLLVAATALERRLTLVTRQASFSHVQGLTLANWFAPCPAGATPPICLG